jgi:hypothetical protein
MRRRILCEIDGAWAAAGSGLGSPAEGNPVRAWRNGDYDHSKSIKRLAGLPIPEGCLDSGLT